MNDSLFEKFLESSSLNIQHHINQTLSELSPDDFDPPDYEDTFFKDLADDIKSSQQETNRKIDDYIKKSEKTGKITIVISIITLIVAALTLAATVISIFK